MSLLSENENQNKLINDKPIDERSDPLMPDYSNMIACHSCDLLLQMPANIATGEKLSCSRCGHKITQGHKSPLQRVCALAITALILLIIACSFPFIAIHASGQESSITLLAAPWQLAEQHFSLLALMVALFIIILPAIYLILVLLLLFPQLLGRNLNRNKRLFIAKVIDSLIPWSMADVFLIAVLVSMIKLHDLASVEVGLSFWAFILFVFMFTYTTGMIDKIKLWQWVDA